MSADLDTEKKAVLLEFRELVSDVLHKLKNNFLRSDAFLEKFLIARGYNLRQAEEMFRKTVEWRQANNVERILDWPCRHELAPYYEVLLPGFDKLGQPVFLAQLGHWDFLSTLQSSTIPEIAKHVTQFVEKGLDLCQTISQNGKTIAKAFIIVDCTDFDYKLLANPKVVTMGFRSLRENCQMVLNHYPECVDKVVLLNVTPMFQLVWSIIKPLLPRATLAKVAIYGKNTEKWKRDLLEHIDPNALPSQYGGAITTGLLNIRFEVDRNFVPKRVLELLQPQDLVEHYLEPRKIFSVDIATKPGDLILWNFKTETYDIGFKVERDDGSFIIEPCRVDAHKFIQKGRLYCPSRAKYTFTWDNSYSYMIGKKLFYAVTVRNMNETFTL